MENRQTYQKTMEERFSEIGAKIDELQSKAVDARDDVKDEWNQQIQHLRTKRAEMEHELRNMNSSSAEAWSSLKEGVQNAWNELNHAVQEASSKFDHADRDRTEDRARELATDQRRHDKHQHDTMHQRSEDEVHSSH